MRPHGYVHIPDAVGLNGHACWSFGDIGDFVVAAAPFLEEGQALGQRLMFVGGDEAEEAVRRVEPMRSMVEDGILSVAPFDAVYPGGRRMPDEQQWEMYAGATAEAVAAGFAGLRVLAEVTALAVPGEELPGQVRWESFADRRMATQPLAALCCFDRRSVAEQDISMLAAVHPVVEQRLQPAAPFNVFGQPDALALAGAVDAFSSDALGRVLDLVVDGSEGQVTWDLEELVSIDDGGLAVLTDHVRALREHGVTVSLPDTSPASRRLSELLADEG
jgi:ABC-type transporter Mla MlaB component